MAEVLLSESEKIFIIKGIQENFRNDGRGCLDYRHIELETDVLSTCCGSAHVRLANTDVLVGVKAELGTPDPSRPDGGRVEFFVDCSANADPEFEGRGGEDIAQEIGAILTGVFSHPRCINRSKLCIIPGQQAWVLYVDVVILECGGSLRDAASLAVKAALFDTKIPTVKITAIEDGQQEIEVSDDPYDVQRLDIAAVPCLVTLCRVGQQFIVDATKEEEACCKSSLVLAVTENGTITSCRKVGEGSLHPESILYIIETGQQIGVTLNRELINKLQEEVTTKKERRGFLT